MDVCNVVNHAFPSNNNETSMTATSTLPGILISHGVAGNTGSVRVVHKVRSPQSRITNGSIFQILSAYSLITRSVEKKPMRATLVIDLVIHSS